MSEYQSKFANVGLGVEYENDIIYSTDSICIYLRSITTNRAYELYHIDINSDEILLEECVSKVVDILTEVGLTDLLNEKLYVKNIKCETRFGSKYLPPQKNYIFTGINKKIHIFSIREITEIVWYLCHNIRYRPDLCKTVPDNTVDVETRKHNVIRFTYEQEEHKLRLTLSDAVYGTTSTGFMVRTYKNAQDDYRYDILTFILDNLGEKKLFPSSEVDIINYTFQYNDERDRFGYNNSHGRTYLCKFIDDINSYIKEDISKPPERFKLKCVLNDNTDDVE